LILDEPFSGLDLLVPEEFLEGWLSQANEMTVLISSHELGEIDGVATHVAFLDEGKLLFEESMRELNGRFRQVHVTMHREAHVPAQPPSHLAGCASGRQRTDVRGHAFLGRWSGRTRGGAARECAAH
jgi:ABC-2 type transport system ATP-binding protein